MKATRQFSVLLCALVLASSVLVWSRAQGQAPVPKIVINGGETRQQIDGFGASFAWQAPFLKDFSEPGRSAILEALFSQQRGAGLSIVRSMVNCSADRTYPEFMTIAPAEGVWEWDHDSGQIWLMQQAKARGATRLFSSVWSPPAWMKTNGSCINVIRQGQPARLPSPVPNRAPQPLDINDIDTRGRLDPSKRQAFADYLSRYVREYRARFGLDLYAISLTNEPEMSLWYDSSLWTGEELRLFIRDYLAPTFARDGVRAKVMMPEAGSWPGIETFAAPTMQDAEAAAAVGIIAGHSYAGSAAPVDRGWAANRRVWQTEVSNLGPDEDTIGDGLRWARDIHDYMAVAESNAWLWWWGVMSVESGADASSGEGLVYFSQADRSYRIAKRLFSIGNYSRFVRPGFVRLDVPPRPADGVYLTAYKDPASGRFVAVAINTNTVSQTLSFAVEGLPLREITPYVTSATANLVAQQPIPALEGVFTATLEAESVTSLVATGGPDLYALGSEAGSAVAILGGESFQTRRETLPTTLPALGDLVGWSFALADADRDGALDLYAVGPTNTTSGRGEVHILDGGDSFRSFLAHTSIALPTGAATWAFAVGDANGDTTPDLYAIGTGRTTSGRVEVHIFDGTRSFRSFLGHISIALPQPPGTSWRFELAEANGDGSPDLYAFGTGADGQALAMIFAGSEGYQSTLTDSPISLPLAGAVAYSFRLGDGNDDGVPDLYAFTTSGPPTALALDGAQQFQASLTPAPVQLPLAGSGPQILLVGRR